MTNPEQRPSSRAISIATLSVGIVAAAATLHSFGSYWTFAEARLFEDYALTWVEPIFVRGALEALAGNPVYGEPSLDYTAAIYNPGIAWLGGYLFDWVRPGLVPLRVFSFGSFAATIALLAAFAQRESRDWGWTCALTACALATCVSARFMTTTIHADSPSLLFAMGALLLVYTGGESRRKNVAAALCILVAFAFKQQGAALGFALAIALATVRPRRGFEFACVCGGLGLLFEGILAWSSDGWAWVYTFRIPMETGGRNVGAFLPTLFGLHPVATTVLVLGAPLLAFLEGPGRRGFWAILAGFALAISYAGYAKIGGAANSLLPAVWVGIAMLAAIHAGIGRRVSEPRIRAILRVGLLVVVAVSSFVQLEPMRNRSARIRAEHARPDRIAKATYPRHAGFERLLRKAVIGSEGRVFVGARFALWSDLGRPLNTHQVGLLEGTDHAPVFDLAALDRLFAEQEFSRMYVWQHPFDDNFEHLLRSHYREVGTLGTDPLAGHQVSIWEPIVKEQSPE